MMPKVSIIIPVYNVEKYLRQCLDSVVNQTLKDIEIICVNDGSTDNSLNILEEYANSDNRIKILQGKKTGAGGARNVGLEQAQGEYLLFLDSDDFFELDMIEKMYNNGIKNNSDIVICNANKYNETTKEYVDYEIEIIPEKLKAYDVFNKNNLRDELFIYFLNVPWNKLCKKSFVINNGILFQEIKRANDVYFSKAILALADRISIVDEKFVHYRVGNSNNLQSHNDKTPTEFLKSLFGVKKFLVEHSLYDDLKEALKQNAIKDINYNLRVSKISPFLYLKLRNYLFKEVLQEFDIKKSEIIYWSIPQIICAWIFSIRNFRYTEYKILVIFGKRFKLKRKQK